MNTDRLRELLSPILLHLRSPWIAGMGILFLAVYAFLGYSYYSEVAKKPELKATRDRWASIVARSGVEEALEEKEAELAAIQEGIPPASLREIGVFGTMWDLATQAGLDPADVEPELKEETANYKIGNTQYRVLSFSMKVSGDFESVWKFVQMLDRGETPYKTLVLGNTRFTLGDASSATMEFKIYTRVQGQ